MKRVVVCEVEGIDPPVLTRWQFYEVLGEDTAPVGRVCVRADDGLERWFPALLFSPYPREPPRLERWQFDEPFEHVQTDCSTISLDLSDGTRRWCNVVTLKWIELRLSDRQQSPGIYLGPTLVLPTLGRDHIEATLKDLEEAKELTEATRLLLTDGDTEASGTE
jgi:hypothetical protein